MNKYIFIIFVITIFCTLKTEVIKAKPKNSEKLVIKSSSYTDEEKTALQKIAIAEAEAEGVNGMVYVMQTIINRVESEDFKNNIIDVIKEKNQFESYTNGRYKNSEPNDESEEALKILLENKLYNKGQLYFENIKCDNTWASLNRRVIFEFRNHRFYD